MVAGGMCGCGGYVWLWGACMVAGGACMVVRGVCGCGEAYMVVGGMHGGGGHAWWQGGMHGIRGDTVNERAVRILLECILVCNMYLVCTELFLVVFHCTKR